MIRLSKSKIGEEEKSAVINVLDKEYLGMGEEVGIFEKDLSKVFSRDTICVSSGTAAVQLAIQACNIGFGDEILDVANNDGRADAYVDPNQFGLFSEYQFSVDDLEQFSGFTIKVVMTSTNECVPVRIKDFRAIALA